MNRTIVALWALSGAVLLLSACGSGAIFMEDDDSDISSLRSSAKIAVSPNPVQEGSVSVTKPVAQGEGFRPGKSYFLRVTQGQFDAHAMQSMEAWVVASKDGTISWPFQEDGFYGRPDARLAAGPGTLQVYLSGRNSRWEEVTAASFTIAPDPGTASVAPFGAAPGTPLTLTGSGAPANASLRMEWYDAVGCTCWMAGCHSCTRTLQQLAMTADASGAFSAAFTPSAASNGYCRNTVSVVDDATGLLVATTQFSLCNEP